MRKKLLKKKSRTNWNLIEDIITSGKSNEVDYFRFTLCTKPLEMKTSQSHSFAALQEHKTCNIRHTTFFSLLFLSFPIHRPHCLMYWNEIRDDCETQSFRQHCSSLSIIWPICRDTRKTRKISSPKRLSAFCDIQTTHCKTTTGMNYTLAIIQIDKSIIWI